MAAFERSKIWVKEWDQLTPLEIAAALRTDATLPFAIAPMLRSGQQPVGYSRDVWTEDASYYTSRKGAEGLIVVFTGPRDRPAVSISHFLQMLRDDAFDVIILSDPRQLHYSHGIRGLGNFLEAMVQIKKFADTNGFTQVLTFGASVGGFPALRAGRLLGARRAFSIGGRYPWHPGRLLRGEAPVEAFDTLCACATPSPTELVSVYARHNEIDARANALLKRSFPEIIEVPIDIGEHNVLGYFLRARVLPLFMAWLFDYWNEAALRTDLLARLEHTASHNLFHESLTNERLQTLALREASEKNQIERDSRRLSKQLKAVYESHSWRLTAPLRAIKRLFSGGWR